MIALHAAPLDPAVVVDGVGAAHGMGLAMDGVLGQARAGWPYKKITGLFYPGAQFAKLGGTIRVGLSAAPAHTVDLPSGGEVSDAPPGSAPGPGFPMHVPPGGGVVIAFNGGAYSARLSGVLRAAQKDPLVPIETPAPRPSPPTPPDPFQTPAPKGPSPSTSPPEQQERRAPDSGVRAALRPVWVIPSGTPAVSRLAATGRRYRGAIEVRRSDDGTSVWAVNHVDLETYVRGIAEEKGAGWPVEGLKVLAVAARSLAAATMQWYKPNERNGFDICATEMCQVYLGLDGEEDAMGKAVAATAGQILTWQGRPILAMYHGNGGGITESYKLLYSDGRSDPFPYLASVVYPFASPSHWQRTFVASQVASALSAVGVAVPGRLEKIEVTERGLSPRVRRVRIVSARGSTETTGLVFQRALGLPSAWFDVAVGGASPASPDPIATADPSMADEVAALPLPARLPDAPQPRAVASVVAGAGLLGIQAIAWTAAMLRRRR